MRTELVLVGCLRPDECGTVEDTYLRRSRRWVGVPLLRIEPAVDDAQLAPLRLHDLRHTAVAVWIAAGASAHEVRAGAASARDPVALELPREEREKNGARRDASRQPHPAIPALTWGFRQWG
jgi:hypothetical protein